MTRQHLILQIRQAYISHIKWRSTAKAIHLGLPVIEKEVAQSPKECAFGQWFYKESLILSNLESYKNLEGLHNKIHHIYQSIYKIDSNKPIKNSKIPLKLEDDLVIKRQIFAYFKDMEKLSKQFLNDLKKLEIEIRELPNTVFE